MGGGSKVACATQGGQGEQDEGTGPTGPGPTTPPGAPAKISASRRATSASRTAILLSRAMSAWDRLGVSTLQTPCVAGSPGVVLLDELWLGRESMTARTARIRERTRRRVVEEMVLW